jgi:hypothetical protein
MSLNRPHVSVRRVTGMSETMNQTKSFSALDGCVMAQELVNEAENLEDAKQRLEKLIYCVLQRDLEQKMQEFRDYYALHSGLKMTIN